MKFKSGEIVFYFLPKSLASGRSTDLYLTATVVSHNKMVRLQFGGRRTNRNVAEKNVVREPPEGAVVR